jgi:hypothetical protein
MIFKRKSIDKQMEEIESNLKTARLKQEMKEFERQRQRDLEAKKRELREMKYGKSLGVGRNLWGGLKQVGGATRAGIDKIQKHNYEQMEKAKKLQKARKKRPTKHYDPWAW